MKINKKVKLISTSILVLLLMFFLILVYHIATSKSGTVSQFNLQISRIDFAETLDASQTKQVCKDLRSINGLTSDSIIINKNVIFYFHDNSITNSKKVFEELMSKRNYNAKPFFVSNQLALKSVCPLMNINSLSYRFSSEVQRIFN